MSDALLLEFVCYVGAGFGVLAYGLGLFRVRRFARVWNTAGLFLTAGALVVMPTALQIGEAGARVAEGWIVTALLLLAMISQGVASLRGRAPRDESKRDRVGDRGVSA